jgi:rare lipoprotein A
MNKKIFILFFVLFTSLFTSISAQSKHNKKAKSKAKTVKTDETKETRGKVEQNAAKAIATVKTDTSKINLKDVKQELDSLISLNLNLKPFKKNAHASYYHNRFNGRRTASGKKFDNNGYTAAHKKLPFGTIVKVTNEANGKSVIVEITDRGPFSKAREIDLSRRAFMDITSNKNSGVVIVTIEEIVEPK